MNGLQAVGETIQRIILDSALAILCLTDHQ